MLTVSSLPSVETVNTTSAATVCPAGAFVSRRILLPTPPFWFPIGLYRKKDGQIGILTDERVVIATKDGLEEIAFAEKDWDTVFFFPDVVYENPNLLQFCTIHVTVYSQKYSRANLELFGYHNHVVFPLYFVDGVAEVEKDFEVPD